MAKREKRKVTQSAANAMQELEKWMGIDTERSEKVLIVAEMLAYGYEVVPTPEEQFIDWYKDFCPAIPGDAICLDIIHKTIDILGIKIKGINE